MEEIIAPISKDLILSELTKDRFLRHTNKGNNEIYVVDAKNAPNTMREIGRLREVAFRAGGGGTGLSCDIDEFDLMEKPCKQLVVWNAELQEIIGGYRYILGSDIELIDGVPHIATGHMFRFSKQFINDFLPYTIELGRSFVSLEYQSTKAGNKAIYALDNLWDGLGVLFVLNPTMKYLFGKVTMYPCYPHEGRNMILYFLHKHFPDPDYLIVPIHPLVTHTDVKAMRELFVGGSYKEDYKILNTHIRAMNCNIPPLVSAYMNLSPTMRMFGTAINDEFGDVEESGILVTFDDIFEDKKVRHISSYLSEGIKWLRNRRKMQNI